MITQQNNMVQDVLGKFFFLYNFRPSEIGQLHKKYGMKYEEVFKLLIASSIRNLAGTSLSVDNFRFNRTYVEVQMHNMLRKTLGGTVWYTVFL